MRSKFRDITNRSATGEIVKAMEECVARQDADGWHRLFAATCSIDDPNRKADALNHLLLIPGHDLHQQITREIQNLAHPSSIPFIRKQLENGFAALEYTCSEDAVIAKWFSHALASIGTSQAISLIEEFSRSGNREIAGEMAYRLRRLKT